MELQQTQSIAFRETVWRYYAAHGRTELPWRQPEPDGSFDPYKILVSELMLQQTQVARVVPKYAAFLQVFPDAKTLARASLGDVLRAWQGLGYNRRAKFLWLAAQQIAAAGYFPATAEALVKLPGVGVNTAGAILAYAYGRPAVFVETNIRTVYIHHFFDERSGAHGVDDKELLPLVEQTLDHENPREFYWALMDYGSYLKSAVGNVARASRHFTRQSVFNGSRRQLRGRIIRLLGVAPMNGQELAAACPDERLSGVLEELTKEGMVLRRGGLYSLD